MKTYELPIAVNYVHTWTVADAIREIMQNAIDSQEDGHPMIINYSGGVLSIANDGCNLSISDLVLGNSSKNDQTKYIGTYGEGFKLAMIVLLRNNIDVKVNTNGQSWIPSFKMSTKFKVETLHIEVSEADFSMDKIEFKLFGIDMETFTDIRRTHLAMAKAMGYGIGEVIESEYGNILLNKQYKGMMFVNGLYVTTDNSFMYGFDFKPEYLHLDRDRKAIGYYKLRELTAKAMAAQPNISFVTDAITKNLVEVRDILDHREELSQEFKVNFAQEFLKQHDLDEDTLVGMEMEVKVAKKPKSYITNSKIIAELVNEGLGKKEEYTTIKQQVEDLSKIEYARTKYANSDFKRVVDFLLDYRSVLDISDTIDLLANVEELHPSYFDLIKDEVLDQFYDKEEE